MARVAKPRTDLYVVRSYATAPAVLDPLADRQHEIQRSGPKVEPEGQKDDPEAEVGRHVSRGRREKLIASMGVEQWSTQQWWCCISASIHTFI